MTTTAFTRSPEDEISFADPRRELTALDRCDACGARAWVRAVMKTSELLFCGHHASEHIDALRESAIFVQDDREAMLEEVAG